MYDSIQSLIGFGGPRGPTLVAVNLVRDGMTAVLYSFTLMTIGVGWFLLALSITGGAIRNVAK